MDSEQFIAEEEAFLFFLLVTQQRSRKSHRVVKKHIREKVDRLNEQIGYERGHIFYSLSKGYTTFIWEVLKLNGWTATCTPSDFCSIYSSDGTPVVLQCSGWHNALAELSIKLRNVSLDKHIERAISIKKGSGGKRKRKFLWFGAKE
ncbi:hypothetical protein QB910_000115 [Dabrowskivirus KKP3916]|uniref:Uncharacterized protein n=1 Tax=Alicyclobacillus phage KKP_3916 TaxID=3040651 RepID=A0AAT9V7Q0_9CAUD|nr:hypothetical protein QB910_000115 [Alicyclobacillus phage KKP 3916]